MRKLIIALAFCGAVLPARAQDITHIEYFIDTDAGVGQNTVIPVATPSADGICSFTADLSNIPQGYHILYMRTKDSDGKWSHTSRRQIEVKYNLNTANIITAEYFFDTDPGFGNGTEIVLSNPSPDGSFTFRIPPAEITQGNKKLFVRVKNSDTLQSLTTWKDITIVIQDDPPSPNSISEINGNAFRIYPNPAKDQLTLQFNSIPMEAYNITLTDINGKILHARSAQAQEIQLDMHYPPGIYLLNIRSNEHVISKKITVTH